MRDVLEGRNVRSINANNADIALPIETEHDLQFCHDELIR
jgi:hypothetical protein